MLRGLQANPGSTFAVVLTLGFGVGANAAMFAAVDRLLSRAPPSTTVLWHAPFRFCSGETA